MRYGVKVNTILTQSNFMKTQLTIRGRVMILCLSFCALFTASSAQKIIVTNVKASGAVGDGVTDDTRAFQDAINKGGTITIPAGRYKLSSCVLKSDIVIKGSKGATIVCNDIKGPTNQSGTFNIMGTDGKVFKNIVIDGLAFEMNAPYTYNKYPACILFKASKNALFQNLLFQNLVFKSPSDNAVLLVASQWKVGFDGVKMLNCKGYGSANPKKYTVANLIRIINNTDPNSSYGVITAKNIYIANCYAKYLRTLADIKRGCSKVLVENNVTENMHDCHHNIDGSFNCKFTNNRSTMDQYFLDHQALTGVNFIEVQGENIEITNNQIDKQKQHGIFISDYGLPEEKGVGHTSRNVLIQGNTINESEGNGIKVLNGVNVVIENNIIKNVKYWDIDIDSKTGRKGRNGSPLSADSVVVRNNTLSGKGILDNISNQKYMKAADMRNFNKQLFKQ